MNDLCSSLSQAVSPVELAQDCEPLWYTWAYIAMTGQIQPGCADFLFSALSAPRMAVTVSLLSLLLS